MIESDFLSAMAGNELRNGEARHQEVKQPHKLAMAAGLTKSSDALRQVWDCD